MFEEQHPAKGATTASFDPGCRFRIRVDWRDDDRRCQMPIPRLRHELPSERIAFEGGFCDLNPVFVSREEIGLAGCVDHSRIKSSRLRCQSFAESSKHVVY